MDGGRIIGISGVGNKTVAYDETDVLQLSLFMNSMWSILKQRRSEIELRRSKEEWEKTFDAISPQDNSGFWCGGCKAYL